MDSKRTSDQQQLHDALRREQYRERMRKYDEEYLRYIKAMMSRTIRSRGR
jgi:hypothetical protein